MNNQYPPAPCGECGDIEYGFHYYVIHALMRQTVDLRGDVFPDSGYVGPYINRIMFQALVDMIASGCGVGFHNGDQGHPTYAMGSDPACELDSVALGDGPEENDLFKTLQLPQFDSFHSEIEDLSTWSKFCTFAVAAFPGPG